MRAYPLDPRRLLVFTQRAGFCMNPSAEKPVALTLTALAPQLFRDMVVRSPCVSFHC